MTPSTYNPIYTVYIVVADGTKYDITPAVVGIDTSEQKKQMAQSAKIELMNIKVDGKWLSSLINVRDRVFIHANDGKTSDEVFRGYVWTRNYSSALEDRTLLLKCYDNLIYLQESEESLYFSPDRSTWYLITHICSKWGIKLEYKYDSIVNPKLVLRGSLSDIITSDILDLTKERKGRDYVILSTKDVMQVKPTGSNTTVYTIESAKNAVKTTAECTMDEMVTKVIILGKADKDDREPIEAQIDGDTEKYGTLQKILDRNENTSLEESKQEAKNIIDEKGKPYWEYEVRCPDIPWIRKGDKVHVNAGDITNKDLIVIGVERNLTNKSKDMTLTLIKE